MNCSEFDLKAYLLGEGSRAAGEAHLAGCPECRGEAERFHLTRAALLSVPDEEPPRRIAFVSDKVFEARWYQRIWRSGPQLGFLSAAVLAGAIVVHGALQPQPAAAPATVDQ